MTSTISSLLSTTDSSTLKFEKVCMACPKPALLPTRNYKNVLPNPITLHMHGTNQCLAKLYNSLFLKTTQTPSLPKKSRASNKFLGPCYSMHARLMSLLLSLLTLLRQNNPKAHNTLPTKSSNCSIIAPPFRTQPSVMSPVT